MLREADVVIGQGQTVAHAVKQIGVTEQTHFLWRKSHGGLKVDQAKGLRYLEAESARLKRAVAELTVNMCPSLGRMRSSCARRWYR